MNKRTAGGFNISVDDDRPDSLMAGKKEKRKIDYEPPPKSSKLPLLITILLLGLVIAGYFDLKTRIEGMSDTESARAQKLAQELETRFEALSARYDRLESTYSRVDASLEKLDKSLEKAVSPIDEIYGVFEQTTAALNKGQKALEDRVETLAETLQQADADLKTRLTEIGETTQTAAAKIDALESNINALSPRVEEIANLSESVNAVDARLTEEVGALSENLGTLDARFESFRKQVNQLSQTVVEVADGIVSRSVLENAAKDITTAFQKELDVIVKNLEAKDTKILEMQKKIRLLEMKIDRISAARSRSPSPSERADTSGKTIGVPPPGTILEQDIQ